MDTSLHSTLPPDDWRSMRLTPTEAGYRIREDAQRFRSEVRTEAVLRLLGIALLLAAGFIWLLAPPTVAGQWPKLSLSVVVAAGGMAVFLLSTRGFRREIHVDRRRRELRVCRLNARNRALVAHRLPMRDVETLYVRRQGHGEASAALVLRMAGNRRFRTIRGTEAEITALHRMLCNHMAEALAPAPSVVNAVRPRPVRRVKVRARTPRPVGLLAT